MCCFMLYTIYYVETKRQKSPKYILQYMYMYMYVVHSAQVMCFVS